MEDPAQRCLDSTNVTPHWLPSGNAFWYKRSFEGDKYQFLYVDVLEKSRVLAFDHELLAGALQDKTGEKVDEQALPFTWIEPAPEDSITATIDIMNCTGKGLKVFWIDYKGKPVYYTSIPNGETKRQRTYVGHVWRLVDSSDEKFRAVYSAPDEGNHVAIIETLGDSIPEASPPSDEDSDTDQESTDGETGPRLHVQDFNLWYKDNSGQDFQLSKEGTREDSFDKSHMYMSPDSQYAVAWQYTPKQDHRINLVESSPEDQLEPKLHTKQYLKPGDRVRIDRPRLFDLKSHSEVPTDDTLFKNPYQLSNLGWSNDSREYRFYLNERGHQCVRVIGISVHGHIRTLVEEQSKTFVDYTKAYFEALRESDELIWARPWMVSVVESVEKDRRRIWIQGYGLKPDQDPYRTHLARVNFDGSDFTILTDGDGTHSWTFSPDRRYFKDTWSRVDSPPTAVLRDAESGEEMLELEKGSREDLEENGWTCPERFVAPGRDGETLIYGIIMRPADHQSHMSYPVIDDIYAGPHHFYVPKAFSTRQRVQRWADQGYVVVQIDGMGTNWRSKAFHDVCYKNLDDGSLPDHIAWLEAAASTRPWMDLSRVGIMGVSAGGQNAAAGMLHHGTFFSAGIADSGCHDNRMDKLWWNELWMGYPVDKAYRESSNMTHAAKLRGPLMLIVGDVDDNVDPSCTFQLANALNRAKKNYELLLIPGGEHGAGYSPYGLAHREIFRIRDEISKHETDPAATFYDILGVPPSASLDDITKAYRKQTRNLHPDKVKQHIRSKAGKDKKTGAKVKAPTAAEINTAVKKAGEAQARLSLIANILRGPERDRYDHFLSNGFPLWKGTDYYYNRYRPGLGTVMVGLFLVVGGGIHYLTLYMSWKRQKEFVERYIKFARDTAWGGGLNIPGVDAAPSPPPAPSPAPASDEEEAPPLPQNRRERRMQEKAAKRDGARPVKKTRRAQASSGTATPTPAPAAGPTGARKRVVAENGKVLVVDSLGDVYLEGEDEEGEVHEFLLDPNELAKPTIKDTAVFRAPIWLFNVTAGRLLSRKPSNLEIEIPADEDDSDAPQPTPSTDSAGEDFELLDKSTDSLSRAKASGASQGKANKRKSKKR
ncbi:hypothetical protein F66182_10287 [Fusarium sp. NRRL 66182]|nr:hypothetical protein F66182_10287 [Fusarium sp. NRRL 66182]